MRNRKQNQGFTLIELLIVIAIIGILAAVLIPNLLSARSRARDSSAQACASALLQQAEIFQIDNNTYDGFTLVTVAGNEYYPGPACSTGDGGNVDAVGAFTADENSISGTVTSLSDRVVSFSNSEGISTGAAAN